MERNFQFSKIGFRIGLLDRQIQGWSILESNKLKRWVCYLKLQRCPSKEGVGIPNSNSLLGKAYLSDSDGRQHHLWGHVERQSGGLGPSASNCHGNVNGKCCKG